MKAYLLAKSLNKLRYKQDALRNTNKRIKTGGKTQTQRTQKTIICTAVLQLNSGSQNATRFVIPRTVHLLRGSFPSSMRTENGQRLSHRGD